MLSWEEWIFVGIMGAVPIGGAIFHLWVMFLGHGKKTPPDAKD